MRNWVRRTAIAAIAALFTLSLTGTSFFAAHTAEASESDTLTELTELTAVYEEAQAEYAEVEARVEENEARIAELEEQLPEQRDVTAAAISTHYKLQQDSPSLLLILLSSESFSDFITMLGYLEAISSRNTQAVEELLAMEEELAALQEELEADLLEAEEKLEAAREALQAAQEAAAAQAAAEAAAAQAAIEAAQETETSTSASGNSYTVSTPSSSSISDVDWSVDRDTFIAEWTTRIDAYLAGSPLAGYGYAFAEAAWEYGVDPRWSPAISCIESSKGLYCFQSYNAWGWGSVSWSDWDTAIRAHVRGLANGYGYTITVAAAQKYCPYNWQHWYSSVLAEMESI